MPKCIKCYRVEVTASFEHIGDYCRSAGPCAHKTGFKGRIPEWIKPLIIKYNLWKRFKPNLEDQGELILGTRYFKGGHYTYLVIYKIIDADDYTDEIAEVYRRINQR